MKASVFAAIVILLIGFVPVQAQSPVQLIQPQARNRRSQAQLQLSQTQRQLVGNLYTAYNEALAAQSAVATMRHAAELATESLRLTALRYQAGESTAQEVVAAQNTFVTVRNGYDDAQVRYRLAIATLRALGGM